MSFVELLLHAGFGMAMYHISSIEPRRFAVLGPLYRAPGPALNRWMRTGR